MVKMWVKLIYEGEIVSRCSGLSFSLDQNILTRIVKLTTKNRTLVKKVDSLRNKV